LSCQCFQVILQEIVWLYFISESFNSVYTNKF
jgi:hypothetical protein